MRNRRLLTALSLFAAPFVVVALAHENKPDPLMEGRSSTIIGVNHVGLSVEKLGRSVAFYRKSAGLKAVGGKRPIDKSLYTAGSLEYKGKPGKMRVLKGPNSFLRIMEFDDKVPAESRQLLEVQGPGVTHVCYIAPKAKPVDGKFVSNGATWEGVGYMYGYLRDIDGLMFEVEHAPEPNFDDHLWLGHVATATPDLTRTLEFYTKALGFEHFRRADDRSGPTYDNVAGVEGVILHGAWFRLAPFYSLEFWQFVSPQTRERAKLPRLNEIGYNLVALETTDIESDFARMKSSGIPLETDIVDTRDGQAFYFRDPDGNLLALMDFYPGSSLSLNALRSR